MHHPVLLFFLLYSINMLLGWGFTLGGFTSRFPEQDHKMIAIFVALMPTGFLVAMLGGWFKWQLRPYSRQQRWELFTKTYPTLSKHKTIDDFDRY